MHIYNFLAVTLFDRKERSAWARGHAHWWHVGRAFRAGSCFCTVHTFGNEQPRDRRVNVTREAQRLVLSRLRYVGCVLRVRGK